MERPQFPTIADTTVVCRCEEIQAVEIRQAMTEGSSTINDVKRRTRAGMGLCQGIFCTRTIAGLLAHEAGVAINSIVPMTARPPARVVPLAALARLDEQGA
jgi:NAD(P)H-nitrite reductase large subunit